MTLLKDNNYKDINIALLSLENGIKKLSNFDISAINRQLEEINERIDEINAGSSNSSNSGDVDSSDDVDNSAEINDLRAEIENINSEIDAINGGIGNIEQKLSNIFSAENFVEDFNTAIEPGVYYWTTDSQNRPNSYGVLLVNRFGSGEGSDWINQVAYSTSDKIYFRQKINDDEWTGWKAVAFTTDIENTTTRIKYADYKTPLQTFTQFQQIPIELSKFSSEVTPNNVLCFMVIYWSGVQLIASADYGDAASSGLKCALIPLGAGTGWATIRCVYMV